MFGRVARLSIAAWLFSLPVIAEIRSLTILHTNDLHARLAPLDNGAGGFAYLAAVIAHERAHCSDCILLNAGDLVQGTPVSTIFHGLPVFGLGNLLGFDAATLGNHEFDYGWEQAQRFVEIASYPIVTANLNGPGGRTFTPQPYVLLHVNGLRVAVIGAMTETLNALTTPKTLGQCRTTPLLDAVRNTASQVRPQADIIVVLAHITPEEETAILDSEADVAVIVSGHLHKGLEKELVRNGRVLVRVRGYGEELGRLELKVDTDKRRAVSWMWKRIPVSSKQISPDGAMARGVAYWEGEVAARVDKPLAVSEQFFDTHAVKRLIERAMREETGADFAFMNQGGVRDHLPKGELLVRNIWNIMPFDNEVLVGRFKGRELPAVVVRGRNIDPNREYTLAVSDYTAANQGTSENLGTTGLRFPENHGLMRDMLIDWFRKKRVIGD